MNKETEDVARDLIQRNILDINYLTIYERDLIIRYEMDYAGNLVPIRYKRENPRRRRYVYRRKPKKQGNLKIGEEIVADLEICNLGDL